MRSPAFRTGLFVLAGIVAVIAVVFVLSGGGFSHSEHFESYFRESVQGLNVGSAVEFRGVTIGKVTNIGLVSAEYPPQNATVLSEAVYHQVVVRFSVDPQKLGPDVNIEQAVKDGLRIHVAPQGITGLAYLELGFQPSAVPPQKVPWKPRTDVIPTVPSTLTQLSDALQHFLTSVDNVKIDKVISNLSSLVGTLNSEITSGDAHQTLRNANMVLADLDTQLKGADLPGTTAALRNLAGGNQTQAIMKQFATASEGLAKSSAAMPRLLAETQNTVAQANEATVTIERQLLPALRNIDAASASLRELSATLERDPSILLRGSPPPPPR